VKEFSPYKDEFFNSLKHYMIKEKSYIIHTLLYNVLYQP